MREGKIPKDWCTSWMVNVYKGKWDALQCGSYRGIRLLEHVMKILEESCGGSGEEYCQDRRYAVWLYGREGNH